MMGAGRDTGALAAEMSLRLGHPVALSPIRQGLETTAFGCVAGGDDFVLRIAPDATAFRKDAAVAQRFAAPALPIPAVIAIGALDDGTAYCLSRRAPGVTLEDLDADQLPAVLDAATASLEAIGSAEIDDLIGAGPFNDAFVTRFSTWPDWLAAALPSASNLDALARQHDLAPPLATLDLAQAAIAACPDIRCLVHGDFGSNNVLSYGNAITGVIDWSEAMIGDPLYDIANIFYWAPWLTCMRLQRDALLLTRPQWFTENACLTLYQRHIGLREFASACRDGDLRMAGFAIASPPSITTPKVMWSARQGNPLALSTLSIR